MAVLILAFLVVFAVAGWAFGEDTRDSNDRSW
jgi:hypothetical protein